jgi:hypothetical protein
MNPNLDADIRMNPDSDPGCSWIRIQPDPDQGFYDKEIFYTFKYVFLNTYKGHLGSRRSLQTNRELSKHEISFYYLITFSFFWGGRHWPACIRNSNPYPDPIRILNTAGWTCRMYECQIPAVQVTVACSRAALERQDSTTCHQPDQRHF